ncbi:MAG: hypothetical protein PGN11_22260 [Quadrisphaera sp.]
MRGTSGRPRPRGRSAAEVPPSSSSIAAHSSGASRALPRGSSSPWARTATTPRWRTWVATSHSRWKRRRPTSVAAAPGSSTLSASSRAPRPAPRSTRYT